ncbi:uncharacterized protein [Onthophagus taurus]|uniref:uncharacterized protein n=1 Tax=Onthophagus taurus TaxID=166361 RepID=UPI000C203F1E|nr:protein ALP1-like [Onthophagus taurus]XP_022906222.1 protein ALP1-like [Onthophagus taurus]
MDRKTLAALILLEEEEDDDIRLLLSIREDTSELYKSRNQEGYFEILIRNHLNADDEKFRSFFRLNKEQFNFVLNLVHADLKKQSTNCVKNPISPEEKLALTLRFLATGETFKSLSFAFRISSSYISIVVRETLEVLCLRLVPIFLPPQNEIDMKEKAQEFWNKWNFPNCVAGVDGKHIRVFCPRKSGSLFFNYKDYFSIVLLAMVDANCKFLFVDVGAYGKEGDSTIFSTSEMGKQVYSGKLFPKDEMLPNSNKKLPYVVVGDEAFRLHRHLMKPYSKLSAKSDRRKTIYNYRLCRARRVTENAFGLLSQIFRIYYTPIAINPESCDKLIMVTCCLHNLLRDAFLEKGNRPFYEYDPNVQIPNNVTPLAGAGGFASANGLEVREMFTQFFNEDGALHWQNDRVFRVSS